MNALTFAILWAVVACSQGRLRKRALGDFVQDYYHRFTDYFGVGRHENALRDPDDPAVEPELRGNRPVKKRPHNVVVYKPVNVKKVKKKVVPPPPRPQGNKAVHVYEDRIVVLKPIGNSTQQKHKVTLRFFSRVPSGRMRPMRVVQLRRRKKAREGTDNVLNHRPDPATVDHNPASRITREAANKKLPPIFWQQ